MQHLTFTVFVFMSLIERRWTINRMCRSSSGLHSGITLDTVVSPGSQLCIVFNSYNQVRVLRRLPIPCHSHWTRTPLRHHVPRATRSRHSVLLSLTLRWASLVMSVHQTVSPCSVPSIHHAANAASTLSQLFVRSRRLARPCFPSSHGSARTHHIMLAASHFH